MIGKKIVILAISGILIFTCLISGSEASKYISKEALWKNKKEVKLEHVFTIGSDDFEEDEKYFFALINDIEFDGHGNLYVLDVKAWRINKYTPEGVFIQSFTLNKGRGPGDHVRPMKIAIDKEGDIFIADMYKRVTILDKEGKLKNTLSIKEKGFLAYIAVGFDKNIYLTRFHNSHTDQIFEYDSMTGTLIKTFCKYNHGETLQDMLSGDITTDYEGNLYYTALYPYEIKKFSKEGKLLNFFSREANFQEPIKSTIASSGIDLLSISMGIAVFPDGKTMNLIRKETVLSKTKRKTEYWFDVYSKDGKWLISFSSDRLKNDFVRLFNIDPFGYLYLDYFNPYPHIKKYKIEFVDKKAESK